MSGVPRGGFFGAGACQYPKDIPDSVSQARAAAARILARIAQGQISVEAVYSEVEAKKCAGCRICNDVCPYGAIEYDETKHVSSIISAACKACGCCAAARAQVAIGGASGPPLDGVAVLRGFDSSNSGITYLANRSRLASTFFCGICWSKLIMQTTRSTPTSSQ